jgi:uncharacterized protein YndB with AHSA1/START domain
MTEHASTTTDRGFTLVRTLPASRASVFAAWTDPDRLHWFAGTTPGDGRDIEASVDLRPGGIWRLRLYQPDGVTYLTGGVYREVVPDERLVYAWGAVGGFPDLDPERLDDVPLVTVELRDATLPGGGAATEMSAHMGFAGRLTDEEVDAWYRIGIRDGWNDTLDRLAPALVRTV